MQFIDLAAQQKRIRDSIDSRIRAVLDHGQYIFGPEVQLLEGQIADYVGIKHALSCASGTDALLMALMAYGIGPGDAILTTPFTFTATAEVIALLHATPVFVDIDPVTFNMDPEQVGFAVRAIEEKNPSIYKLPRAAREESLKVRGVIGVDLFGLPADYERSTKAKRPAVWPIYPAPPFSLQSLWGPTGMEACALPMTMSSMRGCPRCGSTDRDAISTKTYA